MQDLLAAGDRFGPASIFFQISGEKLQVVAGLGAALLEHCANVGFAIEIADAGADSYKRNSSLRSE